MNNTIKLNGKEEPETSPISVKEEEPSETRPVEESNDEEDEEIMEADKYNKMQMKTKITRYKLSLD